MLGRDALVDEVESALDAVAEASCRLPVLFLTFSSAAWLAAGAVLALLASIQLYSPTFMEGCPWVTYGRLRPAAVNALVYGFALQASFALAFWLIVRLGRVTLDAPLVVTAAGKTWNLAVTVGVLGILAGDGTGFELLEFPRYAALGLFASYACLAGWAIVTLHQRTERSLYVSLLFVLAGLLWFPWILSTAHGFVIGWRPPGVVPAVVAGWFVQNLLQIVLTGSAFAVLFYFVPKTVNRPLVDKNFAQSGFWLLLLVGGWGGLSQIPSVPAWIPAVSGAANYLVIVPVLVLLACLWQTASGRIADAWKASATFRFLLAATLVLVFITVRGALLGGSITQFTFCAAARTEIVVLGVFGLAALGALHHLAARLTTGADDLPSEGLTVLAFWAAVLGVLGVGIGFSAAGFVQSGVHASATKDFLKDGIVAVAGQLKLVTAGYAALTVAALAFLANFGLAIRRATRGDLTLSRPARIVLVTVLVLCALAHLSKPWRRHHPLLFWPAWTQQVADLIGESGCGVVTPPQDAGALADALVRMEQDREGTAEMGRKARQLAETRFQRQAQADKFVDVLERVAERRDEQARKGMFGALRGLSGLGSSLG